MTSVKRLKGNYSRNAHSHILTSSYIRMYLLSYTQLKITPSSRLSKKKYSSQEARIQKHAK